MKIIIKLLITSIFIASCNNKQKQVDNKDKEIKPTVSKIPFVWKGANLYFLLTDRFNNGDPSNDVNFDRTKETGKLRGFEGGDIKGITQKINEGYFTNLGINAIWLTPIVEQIHGGTNEGTGITYGYHGYWTKDWTALDPNYGTKEDLNDLVEIAHKNDIRIVLDAVINHTGPVTAKDGLWAKDWVRVGPVCKFDNYENTVACTLVNNLPDIKTESNNHVNLPPQLIKKWKTEGRFEQEITELNTFFERTGYPRAPRFYIIKWLTDYITEFGIDGYRVDTVKHTEGYVWQEFKVECDYAFSKWKEANADKVIDDNAFYLVGEVYNYTISGGKHFDFGDKKVNYFENSFHSLINFEFKLDAHNDYESIFSKYSKILSNELKGFGTLNYLSSHDDSTPFDVNRKEPYKRATKLLLSPGTSQVYYGDESARSLVIDGTEGDATLRSLMNWEDIKNNSETKNILKHWQKVGKFRAKHPAIGAGIHQIITKEPYVFSRSFSKGTYKDFVIIGLDLEKGKKIIPVSKWFEDNIILHDAYSSQDAVVKSGSVTINSEYDMVLLEKL